MVIDKNKLSPDERKVYEAGWQRNAFNQYASDIISIHRSLPDFRYNESVVNMFMVVARRISYNVIVKRAQR